MGSILEQCYDRFIEEFPESWLPHGSEEEVVFLKKIGIRRKEKQSST